MNTALIYDIEIVKAIPNKTGPLEKGISYCAGWHDHANMGVSVVGCYDYAEDRYRVFCGDNMRELGDLMHGRLLVGFNSIPFDNAVLSACFSWGFQDDECYDLLREIWAAAGLGPKFTYPSHAGYGLDAVCEKNFGQSKSGNGALAPVIWQQGKIGAVIDYCLNDVRLTKRLFDRVLAGEKIISPKNGSMLTLRDPS